MTILQLRKRIITTILKGNKKPYQKYIGCEDVPIIQHVPFVIKQNL